MDNLQKCFKVKYCSGTYIFSAKNKLLFSLTLIILNNSSDIINSSDFFLLKVADWQNTTTLGKENSFGAFVNRKIREAGGIQICCNLYASELSTGFDLKSTIFIWSLALI